MANQLVTVKDSSNNNVYFQAPQTAWSYSGQLISSTSGNPKGYGFATIELMPNGMYKISFGAKIDTAGTSDSDFSTGIDASIFTSIVGKTITPTRTIQGQVLIFNKDGALKNNMHDYSFRAFASTSTPTRWQFGRKYVTGTGSDYGTWTTTKYEVGDYIMGTCYGT